MKNEPRTFSRRKIQAWQLLDEQFQFDPLIERYWREEGIHDRDTKIPWRRWLESQGEEVARRYEDLRADGGLTVTYSLSSGDIKVPGNSEPVIPKGDGIGWWQCQESALLKYADMKSNSLEDYTDIIATFKKAIERGATAFSQAKIYRTLGEIYHRCGATALAIEHFEKALRLNPDIGVKKLLTKLKTAETPQTIKRPKGQKSPDTCS